VLTVCDITPASLVYANELILLFHNVTLGMAALKDILGDTLKNGRGEDVKTESLNGSDRVVGLYFSAHWCPPCRGFTPKLIEFYNNFKQTEKGENLEIVFISSDRDESSFVEYFDEMPWLALPFSDRDKKVDLTQ